MSNFELEIFDEGAKCTFYTIKLDGESVSETEKFFEKFYNNQRLKPYVEELAHFIEIIANKRGAVDSFFREENDAHT